LVYAFEILHRKKGWKFEILKWLPKNNIKTKALDTN